MPLVIYINDRQQDVEWSLEKSGEIHVMAADTEFGWIRIQRFKGSGYTCWNVLVGLMKPMEVMLEYTTAFSGIVFQHKNAVVVEVFPGEQLLLQRPQLMLLFPAIASMRMRMSKAGIYGFMGCSLCHLFTYGCKPR
jgi:hypothetical protein